MKISLIGYGKMGKLLTEHINASENELVCIVDPMEKITTVDDIKSQDLEKTDLFIDFSQPQAVLKNLSFCHEHRKAVVIGTTGWEEDVETVKEYGKNIAIFHASNFSIGVYVFSRILKEAARLFENLDEYESAGFEWHHKDKIDAPSGTAKMLSKVLHSSKKNSSQTPSEFLSLRAGYNMGKHEIIFDSPVDSICLSHQAKSRDGFVKGALIAAKWLLKQKSGFYAMKDLMEDMA